MRRATTTKQEMITACATKAIEEKISLEDLERLFAPTTQFELSLRFDFEGTKEKAKELYHINADIERAIEIEQLYRTIKNMLIGEVK